jgi:LmbE family N-acetylglucosaminyl deacetylase
MASPSAEVDLGSLLAVFAHPDDEAYLAGGIMASATDAGRRVVCVTATRGELGFPDDDPRSVDERKALRSEELAACLAELGVTEHHWLDLPDGGGDDVDPEVPVARLAALIDEVRPDTTVTFGPDGQTYHVDHMAVSRWTTEAVARAQHRTRLLYASLTDQWVEAYAEVGVDFDQVMMIPGARPPTIPETDLDVWVRLDGEDLDRKLRALRCQASQVTTLIRQVGLDNYVQQIADEFFVEAEPPSGGVPAA